MNQNAPWLVGTILIGLTIFTPAEAQVLNLGDTVPEFGTESLAGQSWSGPDWIVVEGSVSTNVTCGVSTSACLMLNGAIETTVNPVNAGENLTLSFMYGSSSTCENPDTLPLGNKFIDVFEDGTLIQSIEVTEAGSPFFATAIKLAAPSNSKQIRVQGRNPDNLAGCLPGIMNVTLGTGPSILDRVPGSVHLLVDTGAATNIATDTKNNIYFSNSRPDYPLWKYNPVTFASFEYYHDDAEMNNPDNGSSRIVWSGIRVFADHQDKIYFIEDNGKTNSPGLPILLSRNLVTGEWKCEANCFTLSRLEIQKNTLAFNVDNGALYGMSPNGTLYIENDFGSFLFADTKNNSAGTVMPSCCGEIGAWPSGVPASQSRRNGVNKLSFDKYGNVHFSDYGYLRKLDYKTGYVWTLADLVNSPQGEPIWEIITDWDGNPFYLNGLEIWARDLKNLEITSKRPLLANANLALRNGLNVQFDLDGNFYFPTDDGKIYVAWGIGAKTIPDTTPPVIVAKTAETPSVLGWFNTDVNLSWEVTDAESAISTRNGCDSVKVVDDTAGRTFTCTATSGGGTASLAYTVRRDTGNPLALASRSPFANSDGWNNSAVAIRYSGLDGLSGIASCSADARMETEGAGQTSPAGTCTDPADNLSAPASIGNVNIDLTPPDVQAVITQSPNASGWYNQALNIAFAATDLLSGVHVDACSGNQVFIVDGSNVTASGTCRDKAGNIGTAGVSGLKLDRTPPVTTFTISPAANAAGWHTESVLVEYSGTDALSGSGVASCTADRLVSSEGRSQSFPGQCTDVAGNTSPPADARISIDRVAPKVVLVAPVDGASYITGTSVAANYYCTDATSGIVACAGTVASGTPLTTTSAGTYPFSIVAVDAAGHETRVESTYTVADAAGGQLTSSSLLSFGNQAVGVASAPQRITLVNSGSSSLTIADVSTSGDQAAEYTVAGTCVGTLDPGASCDIEVTLTPLAEGPRSASLVISLGAPVVAAAPTPGINTKSAPTLFSRTTTSPRLSPLATTTGTGGDVGLAGVGVRPSLSIVDGPVDFGMQAVNQLSAPVSLTLTNDGEVPVDITALTLSGSHAAEFARLDGCATNLAVGDSCRIRLVFQPAASGRRNARLNIQGAGLALLSTEVRGIAVNSLTAPTTGPGSAATPARHALELLGQSPALSSGYYWFDPDGDGGNQPFVTFADLETSGGGWMQVRRIPANGDWYPVDDDLAGTDALNAAQAQQFNAAEAWSLAFGQSANANTEFLFAAGDYSKWCVLRRGNNLFDGTLDSANLGTVVLDAFGTAKLAGERTNVMQRSISQDPAIGCEGTEAANFQSLLYAETPSNAPTRFKEEHGGLNVFIRPGNDASRRPTVRAVLAGTESSSGWYTGNVSVKWEVDGFGTTPTLSPGCADQVVTSDGNAIVLSCEATNPAGSTVGSITIKRDATPPTAVATPSPIPNGNGWHSAPVTVKFTGTDTTSGIVSCSPDVTVATEGADQASSTGTCTDAAGNVSATVSYSPLNIDTTNPVVNGITEPPANAAGWNNTAVSISFNGSDALSGVAIDGCSIPVTLGGDGIGQKVAGSCADRAGNSAATTVSGINIDRTPPVAVASVSPAPNAANWHRTAATVTFSGTDSMSGSGLAGCSSAATVTTDGAAQTRSGTCTDVAGNASSTAIGTVNLDATAPTITLTAPASGGSYVQNSTNEANYACVDALSGIIGCLGTVPSGSTFSTSTVGTNTFTVQATDLAGNTASRSVSYTVTAPSPFTLSPGALAFGDRLVNSSTALAVTIRNNSTGALALTTPTLSGTNANQFTLTRTCGTSLAAGASCTVTATFRPTSAGAKTAAFSIRVGTSIQTVPLSGNGVAVAFTVSPTSLAFGNQARNTLSAKRPVTVTNTTVLPITLSTVAISGTNANQFVMTRNCGTTLAASASCTVDVQFRPTTTGSKRATLTVTPSGATAKTVALTGTGT